MDPASLTLLGTVLFGAGAGAAAGGLFSGGGSQQAQPSIVNAPPPTQPATSPTSKPVNRKSQRPSFLSSAMLPGSNAAPGNPAMPGQTTGKTLLGA